MSVRISIVAIPVLLLIGACNSHQIAMPEGYSDVSFDQTPGELASTRELVEYEKTLYGQRCALGPPCEEVLYKFERDTRGVLRLSVVRFGPKLGEPTEEEVADVADCEVYRTLATQLWSDTEQVASGNTTAYLIEGPYQALVVCGPRPALWIGLDERLDELVPRGE